MTTTSRQSNFELLRIFSMLTILLSHFSVHGGFDTNLISNPVNKYFVQFTGLGEIGVDCFVLISGYFLVSSRFHVMKLVKLELEVLFYSLVILLCTFVFMPAALTNISIPSFFIPTLSGQYWFVSTYMLLYALSPFINFFLNNATQKMLEFCLIILLVVYIILPTLTGYTIAGNSTITIFIMLYLLGGYIRLYPDRLIFFSDCPKNVLVCGICYLFIFSSVIFFDHVSVRPYTYFMSLNSLPLVLCSLCLFLIAKNTPVFCSHWINQIAASMFGIYLIHDNPILRPLLWQHLLRNYAYSNSPFLIHYAMLAICGVFVVCTIIDQFRILLLEKPLFCFFQKI